MRNFGPLRHHHCFRFEGKNGQMKDVKYKNFINISFSIATRQQFWLAGKHAEAKLNHSVSYKSSECVILEEVKKDAYYYKTLKPLSYLSLCKYVNINGFLYKKSLFIITNCNLQDGQESICLICDILNCDNKIIFYLQKCKIIRKNIIKNCLEVKLLNEYFFKSYEELLFKNSHCGFLDQNKLMIQIRFFHRYEFN